MTFTQELTSWLTPTRLTVSSAPEVGKQAPSSEKLKLPDDGKETVVVFLRHCGCPFAEKTYLEMRKAASSHPTVSFIAISHSDKQSTENWLQAIPQPSGGSEPSNLRIIIDDSREIYAQWGLGISSLWHVLNPTTLGMLSTLKKEGIDVRSTETGNRWQTSGAWAVDAQGVVRWGGPAKSADEIPDMNAAVEAAASK